MKYIAIDTKTKLYLGNGRPVKSSKTATQYSSKEDLQKAIQIINNCFPGFDWKIKAVQ